MSEIITRATGGGGRFKFLRQVGAGSMGVVYEARDRHSGGRVAVKTLRDLDPESLFRLKNEFRALSSVEHDNLVRLHELVEEDGHWFLVMEFVDGVDVTGHHRRGQLVDATAQTVRASLRTLATGSDAANTPIPGFGPVQGGPLDYAEVRRVIAGIAQGLDALHRSGRVHRDVKPSNVMVARDGRVVLLDFGLVSDDRAATLPVDHEVLGTVPFMAPEQAAGLPVGPEADCYGLGALLFEVLTGSWPFDGTPIEILSLKRTREAPAPSALVPDTPADLDALCVALLRIDPALRPTAADVARQLGDAASQTRRLSGPVPLHSSGARFVGRSEELRLLDEAFEASREGAALGVWLVGPSGIGKSALLRRFIDRVQDKRPDALVLASRCHEHEVLPFKAVDGVIDALSTYLRRVQTTEADEILRRQGAALTELFPVMARVAVVAEEPPTRQAVRDPQERRARAFAALRELFARLAQSRPVVIIIDDLQWGDSDSLQLLQSVLRVPDAPKVMLILSSREDPGASELVAVLGTSGRVPRRIEVGALNHSAATELARHLLGSLGLDEVEAEAVGEGALGSPLYIQEMVRFAGEPGERGKMHGPKSIDAAIWRRVQALSPSARDVLALVVLAGARITMQALGAAAALPGPELGEVVAQLAAAALVRATGRRGADTVEPYHDRVRETVRERFDDDATREYHRRLAHALESAPTTANRAELLMLHFREAGHRAKAARYAERAARQASDQLAFGRSADLYREALALGDRDPAEAREIQIVVAESLARAGRLREAADAFEMAAHGADRKTSFVLRCRALEQILRAGQLQRGIALARTVLAGIGVSVPGGPRRAMASLIMRRAWLRLRGRGFKERAPEEVPSDEHDAVDALWSASSGLAFAEPLLGRAIQVQYVLRALRTGDVRRIALATGAEIGYRGLAGTRSRAQTDATSAEAERLAARSGDPHALALTASLIGLAKFLRGEFSDALVDFDAGLAMLRERTIGARWEIDITELYRLGALVYLGRLDDAARDVSRLASEAFQHGDEYLAIGTRAWRAGLVWLAQARSDELRSNIEAARQVTNPDARGFSVPDFHYLTALVQADLYDDHIDQAWRGLLGAWPALESSMLLNIQTLEIDSRFLRLRCALAVAQVDPSARKRLIADAQGQARQLDKIGAAWASALAVLGRAMITVVEHGATAGAAALLASVSALEGVQLRLHAVAATWRAGVLLGDAGAGHRDDALAYLTDQGVVDAAALCRVLVTV